MTFLSALKPGQRDNPALLVLTGAVLGLVTGVFSEMELEWWAMGTFLLGALLFLTARDPDRALKPALFSLGMAVFITGCGWYLDYTNDDQSRFSSMPAVFIYGFILLQISVPLFMTYMEKGRIGTDYQTLHRYAWDRPQIVLAASLFVGLFWGLLVLWMELFEAIGIGIFKQIFKNDYFVWSSIGASYALGVYLISQHEKIIIATRNIAESVGQALLPLLLLIIAAFLLVLPVTGLGPIWDTGHAADILAAMMVAALGFINAAIRDDTAVNSRFIRGSAKALCLLLPVVALLSFYSLMVRVEHYGFTPERIDAAVLLMIGLGYCLGYAFFVARNWKQEWDGAIRRFNIRMAVIVMIVAALMVSPLANRNAISAWQQKNAFLAGRIDVEEFDFGALRYKFGKPGEKALAEIRAAVPSMGNSEAVSRQLARLDKTEAYYQWEQRNQPDREAPDTEIANQVLDSLDIYPSGTALPGGFAEFFRTVPIGSSSMAYCQDANDDDRCIAVVANISGGQGPEVAIFTRGTHMFYVNGPDGWYETEGMLLTRGYTPLDDIRKKLKTTKPVAVVPDFRVLQIGDINIIPMPDNKD